MLDYDFIFLYSLGSCCGYVMPRVCVALMAMQCGDELRSWA